MSKAVIYVRISRDRAGAGLGVDRQEKDCRLLAATLGLEVVAVYSDNDISAYSRKRRPGYEAMREHLKREHGTVVLAWHTDRLHRRNDELEPFITICEATATTVQTVTAGPVDLSTPAGQLHARVAGAVAQHEVAHARERMVRAKAQAAADGRYRGGRRPFGFEADGTTVREDEAEILRQAAAGILAGRSLASLARELTPVTPRRWDSIELRRILLRPRNAGLLESKGQILGAAQWPAILERDVWAAMVARLTDPARRSTPGPERRHLLSGVARCSVCSAPLRAMVSRGRSALVCHERHVSRNEAALDALVESAVVERLGAPDLADLLPVKGEDTREADAAEARQLRADLEALAEALGKGVITVSQMTTASAGLKGRLEAVEARLAAAYASGPLGALAGCTDPAEAYRNAPLDIRRQVIGVLLDVVVKPGRKGRPAGWQPGQPYADLQTVELAWRTAGEAA